MYDLVDKNAFLNNSAASWNFSGLPAQLDPLKSVSYTHLDVYKRQSLQNWIQSLFQSNCLICSKFSTDPGRVSVTETKTEGEIEKAQILAKFPWGEEVIETLINHGRHIFNDLDSSEKSEVEVILNALMFKWPLCVCYLFISDKV